MGDGMDLNFLGGLFSRIDSEKDEQLQEKEAQFKSMGKEIYAIFNGLTSAGFTEEQAMRMMITLITATIASCGGKKE